MEVENSSNNNESSSLRSYDEVCMAAWNSNLQVLGGLLEQVRKGGVSSTGYGPTHFAASLGNVEVMEFLLTSGVDKNERDAEGNSALMWVVSSDGSEELMDSLVDHGASINLQNFVGETALFVACARGLEDKVEYLLENGADLNIANLDGATALHAAAGCGYAAIVSLLVRHGASVAVGDDEGDSPLHWAVREGHVEATKALVAQGASVTQSNEDGESPLDLAVSLEDEVMMRELSFLAAKPRNTNITGPTFVVTGCSPLKVEEVHSDKDVNMIDMAKEMHALTVREDDWKALRTVSI